MNRQTENLEKKLCEQLPSVEGSAMARGKCLLGFEYLGEEQKGPEDETEDEAPPGRGGSIPEDNRSYTMNEVMRETQCRFDKECADICWPEWDHFLEPVEIRVMAASSKC